MPPKLFAAIAILLLFQSAICHGDETWEELTKKALAASQENNFVLAESLAKRALEYQKTTGSKYSLAYVWAINGEVYRAQNKFALAEKAYKAGYDLFDQASEKLPPVFFLLCGSRGEVLIDLGQLEEAETVSRNCLSNPSLPLSQHTLMKSTFIRALYVAGKLKEAEKFSLEFLSQLEQMPNLNKIEIARALDALARSVMKQDSGSRTREAIRYQKKALDFCQELRGESDLHCAGYEDNYIQLLYTVDQEAAVKEAKKMLDSIKIKFGDKHPYPATYELMLGKMYFFQGKYEEALPLLRNADSVFYAAYGNKSPYVESSHEMLTMCLRKLGKNDEALKAERGKGLWLIR